MLASILKNLALLAMAIILSGLVGELVLRSLTIFPIHGEDNKVHDEKLGYRVSPRIDGIDMNGFRNSSALERRSIVAIGDSHTYGYNVGASDSWPRKLEKMLGRSVYNMGVGGYGILQYFEMFQMSLKWDPDHAIIALYPWNDFHQNYCETLQMPYWRARSSQLELDTSACDDETLSEEQDPIQSPAEYQFWLNHSAFVSAFDHFFSQPLIDSFGEGRFKIGARARMLEVKPFSRPYLPSAVANGLSLLDQIRSEASARGIELTVILIPSRVRTVRGYLRTQKAPIGELNELSVAEDRVFRELTEFFERANVPYIDLTEPVLVGFSRSVKMGEVFYPSLNDHPLEDGYAIYAQEVARSLLDREREGLARPH